MAFTQVEKIHSAKALVYIAGIEVPVSDIAVTYGVNQIPQAVITVPADEELYEFGKEDKVPVAIFYLDQWYSPDGRANSINPTFRLLFDGEITGWDYTESAQGDSISFTATSHLMVLGQMFAKFMTSDLTETSRLGAETAQTYQSLRSDVALGTFPSCLITRGIFLGENGTKIDRPFDYVENLIFPLKIGGYPKPSKAVNSDGTITDEMFKAMKNAEANKRVEASFYDAFIQGTPRQSAAMNFFVRYSHKTKFDRRWIATPIERFLNAYSPGGNNQIADAAFSGRLKDIHFRAITQLLENQFGAGDSFLGLLQKLYSIFTYDILCLPTAPYLRVGGYQNSNSGIPLASVSASSKDGVRAEWRLGQFISKPVSYFTLPPECNIIFPCMSSQRRFEENYATQVTRTISGSPYFDVYYRQNKPAQNDFLEAMYTTVAYPEDIDHRISIGNKIVNPDNVLLFPEEYYKGPVIQSITAPTWFHLVREGFRSYEVEQTESVAAENKAAANSTTEVAPSEVLKNAYSPQKGGRDLFYRYNHLKHFEARYSTRRGSETMAFNPYLIPGYTFVRFAREGKNLHTMGFIEAVSIRISSAGSSTSITYGFGRTLLENYEQAIADAYEAASKKAFKDFYSMSPQESIQDLADTLQKESGAAAYFKTVFYQGLTAAKDCVFRFDRYFKTSSFMGKTVPSSVTIPKDPAKGYEVRLEVKETVDGLMKDYHEAMRKVARPICSLDDYIRFINGGVNVNYANDKANLIPADVYGIAVPKMIRVYESHPASSDVLEHAIKPTINVGPYKKSGTILDLRRDWVSRLRRYRRKIYDKEIQR